MQKKEINKLTNNMNEMNIIIYNKYIINIYYIIKSLLYNKYIIKSLCNIYNKPYRKYNKYKESLYKPLLYEL